jgi:hypothetical protein
LFVRFLTDSTGDSEGPLEGDSEPGADFEETISELRQQLDDMAEKVKILTLSDKNLRNELRLNLGKSSTKT